MFIIFGRWSSVEERGAVAELCPRCHRVSACPVVCRVENLHVFFVPFVSNVTDTTCICGACGRRFLGGAVPYRGYVPIKEALAMPIEALAERTNPAALERLELAQQQQQFADDADFTAVAGVAEQLGAGRLRARLEEGLAQWNRLDQPRRAELAKAAGGADRVLVFARTVAERVPGSSACLAGLLTCLLVWAALAGLGAAGWFGGAAAGFLGVIGGPALGLGVMHLLQRRRLRGWVAEVLITEGELAGIDFGQLAALLQDPPPTGPYNFDDLRPLREEAGAVVKVLVRSGKVTREDGIARR